MNVEDIKKVVDNVGEWTATAIALWWVCKLIFTWLTD